MSHIDNIKLPMMKAPCKECPYRKDSLKGWLGKDRMTELLKADSFICHKTSDSTLLDRKQCAGHMILTKTNNAFVRIARATNRDLDLSGHDLVFDTEQDCIDHHAY